MFYSSELLALRKRGKLARCWLAAFISEKMFKKRYTSNYLEKIDIYNTWIEKKFDATRDLDVRNEAYLNQIVENLRTLSDSHLMEDEPYNFVLEQMMQAEMNFGILSDRELEEFLFLGEEEPSLSNIRVLNWDTTEEAVRESEMQPLVEIDQEIALSEGKQQPSAVEDYQLKDDSKISRKRSALPIEEIPSKRLKIHSVGETIPPVHEQIPLQDATTIDPVSVIESPQELVLQPVEHKEVKIRKRKRQFFDKHTRLSDHTMISNLPNITVHTRKFSISPVTFLSAEILLEQPGTTYFNRPWGKPLLELFKQRIAGPFIVQNEFQITDMEIEKTIDPEIPRIHTLSKLQDQTAETSRTILAATHTTIDQSKTLDKTVPVVDLEEEFHVNDQNKEPEQSTVELPEITNIEDKTGEVHRKPESIDGKKTESSSPRSQVQLSKQDLLALMEVQWYEKSYINFHDLVSPESYSRKEFARAFFLCLELQKEKLIVLKQANPYDIIYIQKCPSYS